MRPYQLLPPLSADEHAALRESIATFGLLSPVVTDEAGNILDGHNRAAIAAELGIEFTTIVLPGLTEEQKIEQVLVLNLARRHLTPEQKAALVADLRARGLSIRWIAERTGIPQTTVYRLSGVPGGTPAYVTGKDGKAYRARVPMTEEANWAQIELVAHSFGRMFAVLGRAWWHPAYGREVVERTLDAWYTEWQRDSPAVVHDVMRDVVRQWPVVFAEDTEDPDISESLTTGLVDAHEFYSGCWEANLRRNLSAIRTRASANS